MFRSNIPKVPRIEMMLYKIMYLGAVCSQTSGSELQYHKFQNTLSYTESSMQFFKKKKALFHTLLLLLSRFSRVRLCATPETAAHQAPRPWDSPGKNTGVGCHFLLHTLE